MDMMHADFDLVTSLLGPPSSVQVTGTGGPEGRGSAAEVLLGYPDAFARCTSSPSARAGLTVPWPERC